jgi:hypothetical protein
VSSGDLSHRLGVALGTHDVTPKERKTVAAASESAETWDDLPHEVRRLVLAIESRPLSPNAGGQASQDAQPADGAQQQPAQDPGQPYGLHAKSPAGWWASMFTVGPLDEAEWALAHEGCSLTQFCRNPLHPGPCKGWKKKLGIEAPGALKALDSAHKEGVAKRRAARLEAKSAAEKNLRPSQVASPLHAKKAIAKQAHMLLGANEATAHNKAAKVILNKTEIKKYSKIKAAQVASIREKHGLLESPGLEERFAKALAEDNLTGEDAEYRKLLDTLAGHMGKQLAVQHCHKGNHEKCDDQLVNALGDEFAKGAAYALKSGDDSQLERDVQDWNAGKLKLPPKAAPAAAKKDVQDAVDALAKTLAPPSAEAADLFDGSSDHYVQQYAKLASLEGLSKADYDAMDEGTRAEIAEFLTYQHKQFKDGSETQHEIEDLQTKFGTAPTLDAAPVAPGKAIDDGLTDEEAVNLAHSLTAEQYKALSTNQKMLLASQLGDIESNEDHPLFDEAQAAYNQLGDLADEAAKDAKSVPVTGPPAAPGPPPSGYMGGVSVSKLKDAFGDEGDPNHTEAVRLVNGMNQIQWDQLTIAEKQTAALHVADASSMDEPGADAAIVKLQKLGIHVPNHGAPGSKKKSPAAPPADEPDVLQGLLDAVPEVTGAPSPSVHGGKLAEDVSPEAKAASDLAHGFKSGTAKMKLAAYEKVSGEEFQQLTPSAQKLILADLKSIEAKFADAKKKKLAKEHHDYLSPFMGGGAGAGGGGNPASTATSATPEMAKALDDLGPLSDLLNGNFGKSHKEQTGAFKGMAETAVGHEGAANFLAPVWADNGLKKINAVQTDPFGNGGFDAEALQAAKPALAADIKKKLMGTDEPTPHLDAFKEAMKIGDPAKVDAFMADAIKASNPGLPGEKEHALKAGTIESLYKAAAPGYQHVPPTATFKTGVADAGALGYNTSKFEAYKSTLAQGIGAAALGGGLSNLNLPVGDKAELAVSPSGDKVLTALTAEAKQALDDGASAHPKGGWTEQYHQAVQTADQAGHDLASKNGWAPDAPVVTEYKKTIMATKLDELAAKIDGTPGVHPTGGAGTGGTASSGSSKVHLGSGTASGFSNEQNQVITGTLKAQGINLSSSAPQVWDVAVAAAAAHQGKDGLPSSLTVLDVLNATDEGHAKNLGVGNANLLRKKVVDWLGTSSGKAYAEANGTPKPTLMSKLSGELSIKLPPGHKVQTLSGPGPYDPKHKGPWHEKNVAQAFADQKAAWEAQPDVPWNASGKSYLSPGYKTKWDDDQLDGLYSYTLGSSTINNYLRGETADGTPVTTASHSTKQTVINIQSAMMPLQEDHLLKRGTGWEQFPKGFRDPESVKKLIGQNVTDKAFMSTSVPGGGSSGFGKPVRMEIEAPKGTHAAFLEGLSAFKGGSEQEMLLAAGQVMRVLSVKKEGHQTVVRVRIVTPK